MTGQGDEAIWRERRQGLRRQSTDAERKLWSLLSHDQLGGRFRRQHQIGPYIVDFYCPSVRLVVEVDGGQHLEPAGLEHDARRTGFLQSRGLRVLRFSNLDVLGRPRSVGEAILAALRPLPSPLPEGEGI